MTPTNRIRLKLDPTNVAVPQGYRDLQLSADGGLVIESPDGTQEPVGSSMTAAEITETLQGAQADPTRIGAEYMPETFNVDWFTCTDQAGVEIPASSYAQKNGVPYFGDAPLSDSIAFHYFFYLSGEPTEVGIISYKVGEYTFPASEAVNDQRYLFMLNAKIDFTGSSTLPTGDNKLYLLVRFSSGTPSVANHTWFNITPAQLYSIIDLRGYIAFNASAGNLKIIAREGYVAKSGAVDSSTAPTPGALGPLPYQDMASFTHPVGTAGVMSFYIVFNCDGTDNLFDMTGLLSLFKGEFASGLLA